MVLENLKEYYSRNGRVDILKLEGDSMLAKLMHGSIAAGITSILAARIRGIDPLTTFSIQHYKKMLASLFGNNGG